MDIKYFTYVYLQHFACFLKLFRFLNSKKRTLQLLTTSHKVTHRLLQRSLETGNQERSNGSKKVSFIGGNYGKHCLNNSFIVCCKVLLKKVGMVDLIQISLIRN